MQEITDREEEDRFMSSLPDDVKSWFTSRFIPCSMDDCDAWEEMLKDAHMLGVLHDHEQAGRLFVEVRGKSYGDDGYWKVVQITMGDKFVKMESSWMY